MLSVLRPPLRFTDPLVEAEFLHQFRRAGIRFAKIAFVMTALMTLAFWGMLEISPSASQVSLWRQAVRLGIFVVAGAAAAYLHLRKGDALARYQASVALPMGVACLLAGVLGMIPLDTGELAANRFAVAMTVACWLCFGFTRLPAWLVLGVCVPASALTIAASWFQGDDHSLALGVYLAVANLIGWIMSVEIERRERALFWNSRQLREAKQALEEMARQAAEADVAKTRVLAAVSHDLRQPLSSLSLYAQLLRGRNNLLQAAGLGTTVERINACVGVLSSNLDRLSELGGLLDCSAPLAVETVDLRSVLERVESVYSAEAVRRGVRLVVRVPAPGELAVTNENRLWDVLSNLVGNALKFTSPDRRAWVLVKVRHAEERLAIVVCDNGIGIAAADQRCVFDEYFQVANRARNAEHGHGLGLAIVRETLSRLPGHSIRLSSRPERGACFTVELPAAVGHVRRAVVSLPGRMAADVGAALPGAGGYRQRETAGSTDGAAPRCESPAAAAYEVDPAGSGPLGAARGEAADSAAALAGAYVLIIEDDASMRDALGRVLEQWGVLVEAAASGEEAFDIMASAERSFDAIVSDFRLPGEWDGIGLIDELRRREGQRTPAILLSGEFRVERLRRDAPEGVHVMSKPPDPDRLHDLLAAFAHGARVAGRLAS